MLQRLIFGLVAVALVAATPADARGRRGGGFHHHHGARVVVVPSFYPYGPAYSGYYSAYAPYDYGYYPGYPVPVYPPPAYYAPGTLVIVPPGQPSTDPEHIGTPRERGLP